ncbi:hypothetical protein KDK88_09715 [bacterium]|nr:hypothetical protein [bacterium]HPF35797.1 hypothetical protein [Candidatus Krumholzibacteria bacterium]HRX51550.1 hypothetical protein [Candidatus Krumholzibacteria bacterium]
MTILQYCSVCKTEYDMEIVPTADDDGVLWLQCPNCRGFLPKVDPGPRARAELQDRDIDAAPTAAPAAEAASPSTAAAASDADELDLDDDALDVPDDDDDGADAPSAAAADDDEGAELLEAMDVSLAVPYRPWNTYGVGDVVHHLAWDDYGVVLAKEVLPGNRSVAKVRFAEAGVVRLIEDQGEAPH